MAGHLFKLTYVEVYVASMGYHIVINTVALRQRQMLLNVEDGSSHRALHFDYLFYLFRW